MKDRVAVVKRISERRRKTTRTKKREESMSFGFFFAKPRFFCVFLSFVRKERKKITKNANIFVFLA